MVIFPHKSIIEARFNLFVFYEMGGFGIWNYLIKFHQRIFFSGRKKYPIYFICRFPDNVHKNIIFAIDIYFPYE